MLPDDIYRFRLYVADGAQNSALALANLKALCTASIAGRCDIEVVDVFKEPERTLADGIFMTPTLLKLQPAPVCRIVGTLGDADTVLSALGLVALSR